MDHALAIEQIKCWSWWLLNISYELSKSELSFHLQPQLLTLHALVSHLCVYLPVDVLSGRVGSHLSASRDHILPLRSQTSQRQANPISPQPRDRSEFYMMITPPLDTPGRDKIVQTVTSAPNQCGLWRVHWLKPWFPHL